jgi:hypothetical protein
LKKLNTSSWDDFECKGGLIYFYQVISELLYPYTIDSFKLPAHNVFTLLLEAKKTFNHIKSGVLVEGVLPSIRSELVDLISKDGVFRGIFEGRVEYIVDAVGNAKKSDFESLVNYLVSEMNPSYELALKNEIERSVLKMDYLDVSRYTKYFLIQKIHDGSSPEFIMEIADNIFQKKKVWGLQSLDDFFQSIDVEARGFDVFFGIFSNGEEVSRYFEFDIIKILSEVPQYMSDYSADMNGFDQFVTISVKSKDWMKAYSKAKSIFEFLSSQLSFINHSLDVSISDNAIISQGNECIYVENPSSNVLVRKASPRASSKIDRKLLEMRLGFVAGELNKDSRNLLIIAFLKHQSALRSNSYATQLVDLWSGVEVLMPSEVGDAKIDGIVSKLVPIVSSGYYLKIIVYLYRAMSRTPERNKINLILKNVGAKNRIDGLVRCLMLDEYSEDYQKIIDLYYDNPLMRNRLEYYNSVLSSPKNILANYKNHQKRLEWQIKRIYRARNLIVHSGREPYRQDTIIDNLHYYFDILLLKISEFSRNTEVEFTLSQFYLLKKFENKKYLKELEKNKNGEFNLSNYTKHFGFTS